MGSIQIRKENNRLILDFYFRSIRCREQTALEDTPANRRKVQKLLDRIEGEISLGTFDYQRYFPSSRNAAKFAQSAMSSAVQALGSAVSGNGSTLHANGAGGKQTPLFKEFAETWFNEKSVEWRESYRKGVRANLDRALIPRFGEMAVGQIEKANVLAFRADLAKVQARGKQTVLSNPRINKMLNPLRMILNEAADRFNFPTPFQNIKQLKVRKTDRSLWREITAKHAAARSGESLAAVRAWLGEIAGRSGFPVREEWADFPENYAAQTQMAWKKGRDHHLVRLRRGYPEPAWHHVLAHEATHIDFEAKARALGRNRWFTINDETRRKALRQLEPDLSAASPARGMPPSASPRWRRSSSKAPPACSSTPPSTWPSNRA